MPTNKACIKYAQVLCSGCGVAVQQCNCNNSAHDFNACNKHRNTIYIKYDYPQCAMDDQ